MPAYILLLVASSLVVVAVYFFLGKSIPVAPPVYYASVGFSLVLSIALPRLLAWLNVFSVIVVYILLIGLFSAGLTLVWERVLARGKARIPADPENVYVGKTVGLLTADDDPGETAFAAVLARHMAATGTPVDPPPVAPETDPPEPDSGPEALVCDEAPDEPVDQPDQAMDNPADQPEVGQAAKRPEPEEAPPPGTDAPARTGLSPEERNGYTRELQGLFSELAARPPARTKARLMLRLSEVYRDLGQYWQAVEVVRHCLAGYAPEGEILNAMIVSAAYCQAILQTLRTDGESPVPYRDLSAETRSRAAVLAGRLILRGGWQGEEIAGNH
ncbi:MAG: hypothetical protein M0Z41_05890 [Peptococcaceae bacterium]|jgi:hypothetical protein|nr:hypothetical protein [Peptococcaceae bacterium]